MTSTGGTPRPVRGRMGSVLALLIAADGGYVSADRLIEEVWAEQSPKSPDTAVHTVISRLRTIVGEDIETGPAGYRLSDSGTVDARAFEEAVVRAQQTGTLRGYESAFKLWTGDPYRSFEDLPTINLEIERLRQLHRRARLEHLELMVEEAPARAADGLAVVVAEDPFNEDALGLYMRALNASGRKPEALQAFRAYETSLAEETGLEPTAKIRELELAILVDELDIPEPPSRPPTRLDLTIEYVDIGRQRRIAVGRAGAGPPLVIHPGWLSKLDFVASGKDFRTAFWSHLAERFELILFDRFGTGLSVGEPDELSFESSVAELGAVIETTVGGPAPVWGASGAGPIAIQTAWESSELVSHLVLYGTYASGPSVFGQQVARSMLALVEASWGMGSDVLAALIFPDGTAEMREGFADFQRAAARPEVATGLLAQMYEADASSLLADLSVPTLVMHYKQDKAVPIRAGEELARSIPGARYLPLDGLTHYPLPQDYERVVSEIEAFVAHG